MKVKVEYTIYKTMEIEIPKALSEAYRKSEDSDNPFDMNCARDDITEFVDVYVKAEEGKDNVDCVYEWDEIESQRELTFARAVSHFAQKLASNFVQHSRLTSSRLCDTIDSESEVKNMTNAEFTEIATQAVYDLVQWRIGNNDDLWGIIFSNDTFRALSDEEKDYFYTGGDGDVIIGKICQKILDAAENL